MAKTKWYYRLDTLQEKLSKEALEEPWKRGRLPHEYWSDERKKHYRETHSFHWTEEGKERHRQKRIRATKGMIMYTNGKRNIWLRQGEDIPEGFYRGGTYSDKPRWFRNGTWIIDKETGRRKWQKH